jgi:hypothetical protein
MVHNEIFVFSSMRNGKLRKLLLQPRRALAAAFARRARPHPVKTHEELLSSALEVEHYEATMFPGPLSARSGHGRPHRLDHLRR